MTNPKPDDGGEMKRAQRDGSSQSQPVSTPKRAAREAEEPASMALLGPPWRTMTLEEMPKLLPRGAVVVEIGPDDVCDVWLADGLLAALTTEASPLSAEIGSTANDRGRDEQISRLQHSLSLAVEALEEINALDFGVLGELADETLDAISKLTGGG